MERICEVEIVGAQYDSILNIISYVMAMDSYFMFGNRIFFLILRLSVINDLQTYLVYAKV